MWQVEIVRLPAVHDFRDGFFPRKFRYKRDAEELAREVAEKGGEAVVTRAE